MKRKNKIRIIIILLGVFLFNNPVFSQTIDDILVSGDPTVDQFLKIDGGGDPDHTGSLNLDIPLMAIPGRGGLNYNINLRYIFGNGVPASEAPSWVGLGWNLNTYQITCDPVKIASDHNPSYGEVTNDMYYLIYPGGSTYIYNFSNTDDDDWQPLNWSKIRIDATKEVCTCGENHKGKYSKFAITDIDGTQYIYSIKLKAKEEYTLKNHCKVTIGSGQYAFSVSQYDYVFKLTEIRGANFINNGGEELGPEDTGNWIKLNYSPTLFSDLYTKEVNYLENIETPTHTAVFNRSTEQFIRYLQGGQSQSITLEALDNIELYKREGSFIKKVNFNYSHSFTWAEIEVDQYGGICYHEPIEVGDQNRKRLRLDSFEIEGLNDEKLPPYEFEYHDGPVQSEGLCWFVDSWGYVSVDQQSHDGYQPTEPYWMLKKVNYPTGGSINYAFESHKFLKTWYPFPTYLPSPAQITTKEGGGVRLKEKIIKNADGTEQYKYEYKYASTAPSAYQGYGIISCEPPFDDFWHDSGRKRIEGINEWTVAYPDVKIIQPDNSAIIKYYTTAIAGVYMQDYSPYSKSFETVTCETDSELENAWYTLGAECSYQNVFLDAYNGGHPTFLERLKGFDDMNYIHIFSYTINNDIYFTNNVFDNRWKRGHLTREEYLSSTGTPVHEKLYYYTMQPKKSMPYQFKYCLDTGQDYTVITHLYPGTITSGWARLDKVETINYDQNGNNPITNIIKNEYNSATGMLVKEIENNSDNTQRITETSYASDKYSTMLSKNMLTQVTQQTVNEGQNDVITSPRTSSVTTWKSWDGYWAPEKTYSWLENDGEGVYSLPTFNFTSPTSNDNEWILTSNTTSRDVCGNILTAEDANGIITTMTWGHNYSRPLSKTINGDLIATWTYDNTTLQLTGITDANSNTIYYEYDNLQRLTQIEDVNHSSLEHYNYYYSRLGNNDVFNESDPNYLEAIKYRSASEYSLQKSFTNSLGLQIQTRLSNAYGSSDLVTFQEYDELQRPSKTYKPYYDITGSLTGFSPISQAVTEVNNWYNGTNGPNCNSYAYTETKYYADPLARVSEIGSPGSAFNISSGNTISFNYGANGSGEVNSYSANTLYKKTSVDENNNTTYEFTDKFGQTVLTRVDMSGGNYLDTYFDYDVTGNLVKTVPPAANGNLNSGLNTTMAYNTLGQLIKKCTPDEDGDGNGISTNETAVSGTPDYEYKYDKAGNLRFILDPNGRNAAGSGYFTYNKYDELNRLIETGKKSASYFTDANAADTSFPADGEKLVVNFYDAEPAYGTGVWSSASDPGTMNNLQSKLAATAYKDINTGSYGYTFYSYNQRGNVEQVVQDIPGSAIGTKKIAYDYDLANNPVKLSYQPGQSDKFYCWYEYDDAGRLDKIFSNTTDNRTAAVKNAEYIYNPTGQFKRIVYGQTAQGVDYLYNSRDWVTQINHQNLDGINDPGGDGSNGVALDRFGMVIGYNVAGHIGDPIYQNAVAQYNGNISWMIWSNSQLTYPNALVGYTFNYDKASRLTNADYGYWSNASNAWATTTASDVNNLQYDKNSNVTFLNRYDIESGIMDQFTYNYNTANYGNRLMYVEDAVSASLFDYDIDNQNEDNYIYDGNGNTVTDLQKNITSIEYDNRNLQYKMSLGLLKLLKLKSMSISGIKEYKAKDTLVTENTVTVLSGADVTFKAGKAVILKPGFSVAQGAVFNGKIDATLQQQTIDSEVKYAYDSQGNRVKKSYSDLNSEKYYVRDAAGNTIAVYNENGNQQYVNLFGADVFGKYVPGSGYNYYVKDHLGSTRAVVNSSGDVAEAYEYYPFGKIARSYVTGSGTDEKFTGKELDNDNDEGLFYFGARYYDGDIIRWGTTDPLAQYHSPYIYVGNNPINLVDPTGTWGDRKYYINGVETNYDMWDDMVTAQGGEQGNKQKQNEEEKKKEEKKKEEESRKEGGDSKLFTHSSGTLTKDTQLKLRLGQAVEIEVENINVLGTTIRIDVNFPEFLAPQEMILLPKQSHTFKFANFGNEPMGWIFDVSTASDAFIVNYTIRSSWVPGMNPNPFYIIPKRKD